MRFLERPTIITLIWAIVSPNAFGQISIPASIDFNGFTGTGFAAAPLVGQLDSDDFIVLGMSDGDMTFGLDYTSDDFARLISTGGVGVGGVYAFDVSAGNRALGFQPTGADFTPGSLVIRFVNSTGSAIDTLDISYDIIVYNDGDRASSFNFAYSLDCSTFSTLPALDFTTSQVADMMPTFGQIPRATSLSSLGLGPGGDFCLRFSSDDVPGSGARDEIGVDNITVTMGDLPPQVTSTTPAHLATSVAQDANVLIQFNEDVNITDAGALSITCTMSGSVAHTPSIVLPTVAPISVITLDPDTDHASGEVCTVTITADDVEDADGASMDTLDGDQDGTAEGSPVDDVVFQFTIIETFTVGGMVSGLAGSGLVLQNNAGDDLSPSGDGSFSFATPLTDGSSYDVTVQTQPSGPSQTCSVTNGSGILMGANITDVSVDCTTNAFTVGGTVSGLAGAGLLLQNNAGDDLSVSGDGGFTFSTPLTDGSAYDVTVQTQPSGPSQTCSVTNGSGTLMGTNVINVAIVCLTDSADLAVTKTDAQDALVPGDPITYMITVTNNGPLDVVDAQVQDTLPVELSLATWQCFPGPGANCTASGSGDISDLVDIPAGESLSYTLTAATDADFNGVIINTVTITAPVNITDPEMSNNSATDTSATDAVFLNGFEEPLQLLKRWLEDRVKLEAG